MSVRTGKRSFVIPAGVRDYEITEILRLPPGLSVRVLNLLPHMHLPGRRIGATVLYAGAHSEYTGLDQLNVREPGGMTELRGHRAGLFIQRRNTPSRSILIPQGS
ncbi:MAG: hypothetical protein ACKV2V_16675 [Blastocatellia bacterium]